MVEKIIRNAVKCKKCNDVIVSHHRHDYKTCSCGACMVDGGTDYMRRSRSGFEEDKSIVIEHEDTYTYKENLRYWSGEWPIEVVAFIKGIPVTSIFIKRHGSDSNKPTGEALYEGVLKEGCGPIQTQFADSCQEKIYHNPKESMWSLVNKLVSSFYYNQPKEKTTNEKSKK